jgi:HPt (histidine-containing phosphotransfer) domain-containing protein
MRPSPPPDPGGLSDAVDPGVLASLRDLAGDDPAFLPGLVRDFLGHADRAVERLRRAAAERDAAALKDAAHGLKGSAGSLGAKRLATLCADLDARARVGALDDAPALVDRIAREAGRVRARLEPLAGGARPEGGRP